MRTYTAEQLVERWEDYRYIENMMGRRLYYGVLSKASTVFEDLWCKTAPDPCLGTYFGYYKGYDAVRGYYEAQARLLAVKARVAQKLHPAELGAMDVSELLGVGSFVADTVTTPLIEIAGDGQSAKGLWYIYGADVDYGPAGMKAEWVFGRIGADFVKEDGQWRIWHLLRVEDIRSPFRHDWTAPMPEQEPDVDFQAIADFQMPEPTVPATVLERVHARRPLLEIPRVPQKYETFSKTFSYGI